MRRLFVLRPEPGGRDTVGRALALGIETIALPLFVVERVHWLVPDPADFDALLLTSANAVRFAGPGLDRLRTLPVHAVGAATGAAAREAGFSLASVGGAGVDALLAGLGKGVRLLHLAGEDHQPARAHGAHIHALTVYRSAPVERSADELVMTRGAVVAVHSRRAGERLAQLIGDRGDTALVALSAQAASAVGDGWQSIAVAERPSDAALLAIAAELCL